MKSNVFLMSLCVAALMTSQTGWAEKDKKKSQKQGQTAKSESQAEVQGTNYVRLSELIGAEVSAEEGEAVAEIKDFVVNPATRQIQFALLDAEFSEKLLPVPWQALSVTDEDECTLHCEQERLQSAPAIDEDQFTALQSPDYILRIYRFYEITPPSALGAPGQEQGVERGTKEQTVPQN